MRTAGSYGHPVLRSYCPVKQFCKDDKKEDDMIDVFGSWCMTGEGFTRMASECILKGRS